MCLSVCVRVPSGTVLLPYFVSQGKAGSGLLVLSWPSFSPLEAIFLKRKASRQRRIFRSERACSVKHICSCVHFCARLLFITCHRRVEAKKAMAYLT